MGNTYESGQGYSLDAQQISGTTISNNADNSKNRVIRNESIRKQLEAVVSIDQLPATVILGDQLEKSLDNINQEHPNLDTSSIAYSLSNRFFDVGLYNRISGQSMFGLKDYELSYSVDQYKDDFTNIQQELKAFGDGSHSDGKIVFHDGWMHYLHGKSGETSQRIYLSSEPRHLARIFSQLADSIPSNVPYKMKTLDPSDLKSLGRIDNIIVYCDDDNFDKILSIVEDIHSSNQDAFKGRMAPGGGAISIGEGFSIAKQPEKTNGLEVTGTQEIANKIGAELDKKCSQILINSIYGKNPQEARGSEAGAFLKTTIIEQAKRINWFKNPADDQKNFLNQCWGDALYQVMIDSLVAGTPIRRSEFQDIFAKKIKSGSILSPEQQSYYSLSTHQTDIAGFVASAANKSGLAIVLSSGLKDQKTPSEIFNQLVS
ncbi:MAG: T3SS effector HopA1 family protein [bacterium]